LGAELFSVAPHSDAESFPGACFVLTGILLPERIVADAGFDLFGNSVFGVTGNAQTVEEARRILNDEARIRIVGQGDRLFDDPSVFRLGNLSGARNRK
jgi:hypothetical protein